MRPELISDQVSVDPIEEVLCSSLVSREASTLMRHTIR